MGGRTGSLYESCGGRSPCWMLWRQHLWVSADVGSQMSDVMWMKISQLVSYWTYRWYIRTYIYIYTYVCTYTHTHIYIYTHMHTHTYIYIYRYIHLHTYTHTHIHTHLHTYTHIYTHIYIYKQIQLFYLISSSLIWSWVQVSNAPIHSFSAGQNLLGSWQVGSVPWRCWPWIWGESVLRFFRVTGLPGDQNRISTSGALWTSSKSGRILPSALESWPVRTTQLICVLPPSSGPNGCQSPQVVSHGETKPGAYFQPWLQKWPSGKLPWVWQIAIFNGKTH